MRIARVLHGGAPTPIIALERDGALYSVAELDRRWRTRFSPERFALSDDFHTRVIALACAGLGELDDQLRAGARPTEARLQPGSFLWLAPCATDRCAYVQVTVGSDDRGDEPRYRIGNARSLLGHETSVPFPANEPEPALELGVGAVLGEDVRRATAAEAEKAILGYAVLDDWTATGILRASRARGEGDGKGKDFGTQLGPVLVTKDELGDASGRRAEVRVGEGAGEPSGVVGGLLDSLVEAIAYVSDRVELRAGDVIGAGPLAARAVPYGETAELAIDRLGALRGRPVRGPEPVDWRRR